VSGLLAALLAALAAGAPAFLPEQSLRINVYDVAHVSAAPVQSHVEHGPPMSMGPNRMLRAVAPWRVVHGGARSAYAYGYNQPATLASVDLPSAAGRDPPTVAVPEPLGGGLDWSRPVGVAADSAPAVGKALEPSPWPLNDGFMHDPVPTTLRAGTRIDRFGGDGGRFTAREGTPLPQRSMRLRADRAPYSVFELQQDLEVQGGITAPAFGQPGGGIQYTLPDSVANLLNNGTLRRVP
jgi:hypothetical protein